MNIVFRLRVIVSLFAAVLLPLEVGHCALMPLRSAPVAIESGHHDDGDHDCCDESAPAQQPTSPTDSCCCGHVQLPAESAAGSISLAAPASALVLFAVAARVAAGADTEGAPLRLERVPRSGSPPDPSTAPQSPRSPPYSA